MTLKDISNGPSWIMWVAGILLAILSIVLISGHGANLIAGINTQVRKRKAGITQKECAESLESAWP